MMFSSDNKVMLSLWASLLSSWAELRMVLSLILSNILSHINSLLLRDINVLIHTLSSEVLAALSIWNWAHELGVDADVRGIRGWAWEGWEGSPLTLELLLSGSVLLS